MKVASLMKRKLPSEDALADRPSPRDLVAYRAWLKSSTHDAKIEALRARLRETQDRILEAEANGGKRGRQDESQTRVERRASALIGESKLMVVGDTASLDDLFEERAAIEKALTILGDRKTAEFIEKISGELLLRRDEFRELSYRRARWAIEGKLLHAETESVLASLAGSPNGLLFPGSDISLQPLLNGGGTLARLIAVAIKAGIVTQKEIQ